MAKRNGVAIAAAAPAGSASKSQSSTASRPPRPPGTRWTDEQWAGVSTTGHSLLVSAAAGSGKTAVLAERCVYLVCDAPPPRRCDVDELLVVTFTDAAAAEMKSRIDAALHERIAKTGYDQRLARQLMLIDRASVSTLHGFCARLIRQHFHLLDLDPAFTVLDGDEARLLRNEVARELFEERYSGPASASFHALVDAYADGNDARLLDKLLHTHELLGSLVDPAAWIARARHRIAESVEGDFPSGALGQELRDEIDRGITSLRASCASALAAMKRIGGFPLYEDDLRNCADHIDDWTGKLERGGIDAVAEAVANVELEDLPRYSNQLENKKLAKSLIDDVREQIKKGPLKQLLSFSTQEWRDGLAMVRPHANEFLDLVEAFGERYTRAKAALRAVDFSDLERLTLRLLRDAAASTLEQHAPTAVARTLRKQFAYVLVDEYQDINELQDAILSLVAGRDNLFCVGDVKQSIYRFRLAEPTRFLDREKRFRADARHELGEVIDLKANFRSRGPLLDVINAVFRRLMTRDAAEIEYDASHELVPRADYPPAGSSSDFTGSPIELHVLPDDAAAPIRARGDDDDEDADADEGDAAEPDRAAREAMLIARRIRELMATKTVMERDKATGQRVARPMRFRDVVILLRAMKFKGQQYADVLRQADIPVHVDAGSGYFESMEVNDVLSLLKVLDNRAQDVPLAAVLRSPIASLPEPEDALARVRIAYPATSIAFHAAVAKYAHERDDELAAALRDVLGKLDHWRRQAQRRPLAEVIWEIYDSTGYLAFCAGLRDGEQRKANLIDLHDRALQFGSFQRQGLARFLRFLDQLRDESDLGQPSVVGEGEEVIRIMTVHRSKGLEFPVVFLPDLGKRINLQELYGSVLVDRHATLGMDVVDEAKRVRYPSLASKLVGSRLRRAAMAEELRVLYVAMTRAQEHLVLIGTAKADAAEDWQARWGSHAGPLPAGEVVGSLTMLGWLGPVAAATARPRGGPIKVTSHTPEEVAAWRPDEHQRGAGSERLERLARLDPLTTSPQPDPEAAAIVERLTTPYAYERFTKLAAVEAATALTKKGQAPPVPARRATRDVAATGSVASGEGTKLLELPRAVRTELKPSAADVGEATHLVLQHLDFTRPCDRGDLRVQLDVLVERRLLAPAAAKAVDLDSICWLIGSPVGELLRTHGKTTRRELPLYLALPAEEIDGEAKSSDPADQVMVRSRADALVRTSIGLEIVDYKTDRVDDSTIDARVEYYRPQMDLYRRAIHALTGEPVARVHLVFLQARRVIAL
jgi:ATP-dependent helicase/nuclease subunit A